MAVGLRVKRTQEEEERTPPLNVPFPWVMTPFPYAKANVEAQPPLKRTIGIAPPSG